MTVTATARRIALVGLMAMMLSLLPLAVASAQDDPERIAYELNGETAVDIAQAWSELAYPDAHVTQDEGPTEVLLGRDDVFADNLASGSLQGGTDNGRPLLLTGSDALDQAVIDELERLGGVDAIDTVHVLGGNLAVSDEVEAELNDLGYDTNRFEGATRTETAIDIAAGAFAGADTALLVRSNATADDPTQEFADSLGAGAWAAEAGVPVLFTLTETLTATTAAYLASSPIENVIIVGGESAVSPEVATAVDEIVESVDRVAGDTRFTTAVAVNDARELGGQAAVLVDGQIANAWVNGFASANVSGTNGYPLVLSNQGELPTATEEYLEAFYAEEQAGTAAFQVHLTDVYLICGTNTGDACDAAAAIAGATVVPFPTVVPPPVEEVTFYVTDTGDATSLTYYDSQADELVTIQYNATTDYTVDEQDNVSQAFFNAELTVGDIIVVDPDDTQEGSDAVTAIELTNFVGGDVADVTVASFDILVPGTDALVRDNQLIVGAASYVVDGETVGGGAFGDDLSLGDFIEIDEDNNYLLDNRTFEGTIEAFDTLLTTIEPVEAPDVLNYDGDELFVGGEAVEQGDFEDALVVGLPFTYAKSGGVETYDVSDEALPSIEGVVTAVNADGTAPDSATLQVTATTTQVVEWDPTVGVYVVDGQVTTEPAFRGDLGVDDHLVYTPDDPRTAANEQRLELTNRTAPVIDDTTYGPGSADNPNPAAVELTGTAAPGATVSVTVSDNNIETANVTATATANGMGAWTTTVDVSSISGGDLTTLARVTDQFGSLSDTGTITWVP